METKELATREEQAPATKELEFSKIRERLTTVLDENKSACVKINGRLEITRPVAIAMLNQLSRDIAMIGGKVSIKKDVLNFSPVVVKSTCEIQLPNGAVMHFEALGSAEESDIKGGKRIYHDTIGTAETRSLKRLLEEVVGEDFINKVLTPIVEKTISEKQANYIKSLAKKTGVKISEISKKVIGREISNPEELMQITSQEARKLIDEYQKLAGEA